MGDGGHRFIGFQSIEQSIIPTGKDPLELVISDFCQIAFDWPSIDCNIPCLIDGTPERTFINPSAIGVGIADEVIFLLSRLDRCGRAGIGQFRRGC